MNHESDTEAPDAGWMAASSNRRTPGRHGPLRILHVLTHANATRGGAIQALLLARAQLAAGHAVRVVVNSSRDRRLDATFDSWLDDGIPIEAFDQGPSGAASPLEGLRFRRLVETWRPHVVHAHRDTALVFAWCATTGLELPAFVSQRGTTHPFRTKLVSHVHRSPRVHRIVAVAHAVKKALVSFGIEPEKVEIVYGSFDFERFDPRHADRARVRAELGLRDDQPLIVQVGELHRKKGPLNFVEAAARVLKVRPDCVFAFVGKGSQEKKVTKRIAELGVGDQVRLLGFRRDVADVYAACDIAINCSVRDEGLTGAVREALAMAKPCIATRTDGNPEIVRDGETGLLVDMGDDDAMAAKILELLGDPARAKALGERGRALVVKLMAPQVRLANVERVYRDVLAEQAAGVAAAGGGFTSAVPAISRPTIRRSVPIPIFSTLLVAGLLLLISLPLLATYQITTAARAVDGVLDEGVLGLDEIEDLLQNLIDLRSGVLELAIEVPAARSSLAPSLRQQVDALRRDCAELEAIDLDSILDHATDVDARVLAERCATDVLAFLDAQGDPERDETARSHQALAVSARIDSAATELNELADAIDRRARMVDSEVPDRLRIARYATAVLAVLAAFAAAAWAVERRTRPDEAPGD